MHCRKSPARVALEELLADGPQPREVVIRTMMDAIPPSPAIRARRQRVNNKYPVSLGQEIEVGRRYLANLALANATKKGAVKEQDGVVIPLWEKK